MSSSRPVKLTGWKLRKLIFFGVVERKLDDAANLFVVDAVDDGGNGNDFDAGLVKIVNRLQLDVEQVANLAVGIGCVADAIELEIGVAQAGFGCCAAKLFALGEFNSVRRGLHAVVANLARVSDGVEEVRRECGLAARELNAHLPLGLDGDGVVEHGLNFFPK